MSFLNTFLNMLPFIRERLSEYSPYPILEKCSNSAEDLTQQRFTPFPSTLSARCFAFPAQLKPYISLNFLLMAPRVATLIDGEEITLPEKRIAEAAALVLGRCANALYLCV